ncbi:hypothetical protein M0R04_12845 [Candidatus Dojkabacteria bacterium]|jgi:hypothetical protein|nr:hypothetical protein [Candidatus Dojkabacteria bacterium]
MFRQRKKTRINCSVCNKDLFIRNDYIKTHKGMCNSCESKLRWEDIEYRENSRRKHLGQVVAPPLPYGEANFNGLFYSYKKSAQARGIEFNLTKEQFKILTKQDCYYCGIEPLQTYSNGNPGKWRYGLWIYNGIDRKDESIGYEIDNCVPCCKKCNYAKQGMTDIEFLEHVIKIYNNHVEKDTIGSRTLSAK